MRCSLIFLSVWSPTTSFRTLSRAAVSCAFTFPPSNSVKENSLLGIFLLGLSNTICLVLMASAAIVLYCRTGCLRWRVAY